MNLRAIGSPRVVASFPDLGEPTPAPELNKFQSRERL